MPVQRRRSTLSEQQTRNATDRAPTEAAALELTLTDMTFWQLAWSDYEMALLERREETLRSRLLYLPRLLLNPSLQLAFLVRLAQKGPRSLLRPIRLLQNLVFSSEICEFGGDSAIQIGPAIAFPHPWNVIIGHGTQIGAGVTIYNNTGIGGDRHQRRGTGVSRAAKLGDRSVIYAYSAIQGPYDVGQDAVVGIHVVLDGDVPPGALRTHRKLHAADEWPGEGRPRWRLSSTAADRCSAT